MFSVQLSHPISKSLWSCRSYFNNLFWGERIRRITGRCILTIESSLIFFVLGMFGSGVASYFKFLRWLCVLNLILTVFIFSFICLPQVSTLRIGIMYHFVLLCSVVQLVYNDEGLDASENYTYPVSLVVDGRVCFAVSDCFVLVTMCQFTNINLSLDVCHR